MAHHKSAKKRIRQSEKRRLRNRMYKSRARTFIKRARKMIESGNLEEAEKLVQESIKALDRAAERGVLHKNNVARRKSRLMRYFNKARSLSA